MVERVDFFCNVEKYAQISRQYREKNDCTVVAFAEVFNVSYEEAHLHLKTKCGRVDRKGLCSYKVIPDSITGVKIATRTFGCTNIPKISLGNFIKQHPVGRYYVCVRGHALAVIDGVIHDHSHKPRRMVRWAMRVHL